MEEARGVAVHRFNAWRNIALLLLHSRVGTCRYSIAKYSTRSPPGSLSAHGPLSQVIIIITAGDLLLVTQDMAHRKKSHAITYGGDGDL